MNHVAQGRAVCYLPGMVHLSNWRLVSEEGFYCLPKRGDSFRLKGETRSGSEMTLTLTEYTTSRVAWRDGFDVLVTSSGTLYGLKGRPADSFAKWLRSQKIGGAKLAAFYAVPALTKGNE